MVKICKKYNNENENCNTENYNKYFNYFNFPLSDFQKWAIESIVSNNHCLVTAHTGSGKTLPAEFAIQYFKEKGKKVIYTGPIKALCNQKLYDFRNKYPNISFGILTGDIKDNPDADVLIMTTEILRNTLFNKEIIEKDKKILNKNPLVQFEMDFQQELAAVIFDEVHYIGDEDRGSVWEQSIMLLPNHVQLIMLSATINKPDLFAKWVEELKIEKEVYLCATDTRVVPLIHYNWLSCHNKTLKAAIKNDINFKKYINKPIILSDNTLKFNEENYKNILNTQKIIEADGFIKRKFILNDLIKYLNLNNMLPAICFIFSRKNVEVSAKEIDFSLFKEEDKTPNVIENECKQFLIKKLTNYKEYIKLPEYIDLINLLKKGIAIHHAGMMPILREIVELLFEKNYIKLLFATETFAVGINMPTKTVIFTSLRKFDGNGERELYSHEYTQMAGRAGRRGIDTIGHVIHCNNLFKLEQEHYKKILSGGAKLLTSKFKISFNLLLKIIYSNQDKDDFNIEQFKQFIGKSMIKDNLDKEYSLYLRKEDEFNNEINNYTQIINNLNTPKEIILEYKKLKSQTNLRNNQKKKNNKLINDIESKYDILNDYKLYKDYEKLLEEQKYNTNYKTNIINYFENNIQNVLSILINNNFITSNFKILEKGIISSQIQEIHSLIFGELYEITQGFQEYSTIELICIFSCFTNINVDDSIKVYNSSDYRLNEIVKKITNIFNKYQELQNNNYIPNDTECIFQLDLLDILPKWINANNEGECLTILDNIKYEKNIFLGDFVKAILKINTIANELDKICDILNNFDLKQKLVNIGQLTLKYIATNQSLYI